MPQPRDTMGCVNSSSADEGQRTDGRQHTRAERTQPVTTGRQAKQQPRHTDTGHMDVHHGTPMSSNPMTIEGSVGHGAQKQDNDPYGRSVERRQQEKRVFLGIVQQAGDTFIDVSQSALDFEPEDASDAAAQAFSRDIRGTAISDNAITILALPKPCASNTENLFANLAAPLLSQDQQSKMARVSDAVVGAVGGMKVEYSGEPVVVQLSIG